MAVTKALEFCPNNLEAMQTMASLRISQCRQEDACIILENLVGVIKEKLSYYTNRNIAEEFFNPQSLPSDIPSLDFLIAFCKLLVECSPYRGQFSQVSI